MTLHDCLSFFTGARDIPPTGFDDMCTLNFNGCFPDSIYVFLNSHITNILLPNI